MVNYTSRLYLIKDVIPGMTLAEDVITPDRNVLLSKGIILTSEMIKGLYAWGVLCLTINEETLEVAQNLFPAQSPIILQQYNETVEIVRNAFNTARYFKEVPLAQMQELSNRHIGGLINSPGIINFLQTMRSFDHYTFQHSVNVAIIVGLIGKWVGYNGLPLQELILSGLLHDIGKTQIPREILNKPNKLSDKEMASMKLHTVKGYELLTNCQGISELAIRGVLQHHERLDGSGYPQNLKAERIHDSAKMIAVADIYDAMTSERVYHKKATPFDVIEVLVVQMFGKLDPSVCTTFLNNVRNYFIGNMVVLSDGRKAVVTSLCTTLGSRPIVRTLDNDFIDLEIYKDISIVASVAT